jgi:hypothetical protein
MAAPLAPFPPPIQAFEGWLQRESIVFLTTQMDPRFRGDDDIGSRGGTHFVMFNKTDAFSR